jgi:hypothetical protein
MPRFPLGVCSIFLLLVVGCGGTIAPGGGSGNTSSNPQPAPNVSAIAPTSAVAGNAATQLVVYGSAFQNGAMVNWNGGPLTTTYVSPTQLSASVPSSNLTSAGSASITVTNPTTAETLSVRSNAASFTIIAAPPTTTWIRPVAGVVPQNIAWDPVHAQIYASIPATAATSPNTIVAVDPVAGKAGTPVPAGNNPNLLSISSDASYLWVGLDGSGSVQRFRLPALTPDISFPIPKNSFGNTQTAVSLEAARVSTHTVAVVGSVDGVYVYDDATPRQTSIPAPNAPGGTEIGWVQWGNDDTTLFGTGSYSGYLNPLKVTASGVTWNGQTEQIDSIFGQYFPQQGLLYSYGRVFDPVKATQTGEFNVFAQTGAPNGACTADASLGRYYCAVSFNVGNTGSDDFQLWVYDLNTYTLLNAVDFGTSPASGATITGWFNRLVRWGNAGLALSSTTDPSGFAGVGGLYLIDGAAVNPNAAPDVTAGTPSTLPPSLSSLSPQSAPAGSADLLVTITGENFSSDTVACWNCNSVQLNYLPTAYLSPTQLSVTIPAQVLATAGTLSISLVDTNSNSSGRTALPFTIFAPPASATTTVSFLNLSGLDMRWDAGTQLLYVATADYDPAYPNSIVALDPATATISGTQFVGSDPAFLDVSAEGKYLYVAYDGATNETQLALPGLNSPVTWTLANATPGTVFFPGDLKAAPENPDLTAVTLIDPSIQPSGLGGIVLFNDATELPRALPGWSQPGNPGYEYNVLAWGNSDAVLAAAENDSGTQEPLYTIAVNSAGPTVLNAYPNFNQVNAQIHSDFGTGLVYSDDGNVANPVSGAMVGSYNASGLLAPDSTLNRVFILGQTSAQSGSRNYTVESFDEKGFTPVSSLTLNGLAGLPFSMVRWGNNGLAVLSTSGMLYIVQDASFVSSAPAVQTGIGENVKVGWNRLSRAAMGQAIRQRPPSSVGQNPFRAE